MKKTLSWFIVGICSIFLIIFTIMLIISFVNIDSFESIFQLVSGVAGIIFMIFLTIIGIRYGLKNIRVINKMDLNLYTETIDMNFVGQIKYKDYRNLILGLTYRKPIYIFFILIIFTSLIASYTSESNNPNQSTSLILLSVFVGITIISPILTIYKINKIYKSTNIFQEELSYQLNNESIHIKGSTVDSVQTWKNFIKIKETDSFILLYQNELIATLIDKKMINPKELNKLRMFLKSLNINN